MIPLKDDVPSRSFPLITVLLIAMNVLAYFYQASLDFSQAGPAAGAGQAFMMEFGLVPCRLTGSCTLGGDFPSPTVTIFTSMFMHGSWFHVGGNMLYLWIFGDNVEDTLGHGRFAVFYLAVGVAAALAQVGLNAASRVPMVGASGAVSGVLGAYLLLFPYARVLTLLIIGFFVRFVYVPAIIVLGFWIVVQLINGFITFSAQSLGRGESGGVAWFAHVGGFLAGMLLLFLFRPRQSSRL